MIAQYQSGLLAMTKAISLCFWMQWLTGRRLKPFVVFDGVGPVRELNLLAWGHHLSEPQQLDGQGATIEPD